MTSPQAATSDVVAAMATTGIDHRPPSVDLTAEDHAQTEVDEMMITGHQTRDPVPATSETKGEEQTETTTNNESAKENGGSPPALGEASLPILPEADPTPLQLLADPGLSAEMLNTHQMGNIATLLTETSHLGDPQQFMNGIGPTLPSTVDEPVLGQPNVDPSPYLEPSPYLHEIEKPRISAYAKLEFPDGEFYMNTFQITLGRDQKAAREAQRREYEQSKIEADALTVGDPITPTPRIKEAGSRYSKSVISEAGGILREEDLPDIDREERRRRRKASKKSKSEGSSSRQVSRKNSFVQQDGIFDYQAQTETKRYIPDNDGAAPLDPGSLRPSPHDCPLVGIHPPASTPASGHKGISRQHVKIAFNDKKYLFEATILGRNGAFIDDIFYHHKEVIELKSGSVLQIGAVTTTFVLPDVALGETGAMNRGEYDEENLASELYSQGGKEMSFEFERGFREDAEDDVSETSQDDEEGLLEEKVGLEEEEADADEDEDEDEDAELGASDMSEIEDDNEIAEQAPNVDVLSQSPNSERKRGPGRPPKNGIMSKREEKLAKKHAAALAAQGLGQDPQQKPKKTVPDVEPGTAPVKNKVGRPRKHPRPDTPPIQREKRKYTKRKPKEPKEGEIKEEGSGGEGGDKKEKRARAPRSPTPVFNEADLTPEQLAKPQANYVTLIHEALSKSETGALALPSIYKAIMRNHPWFACRAPTNGWQSSVRHNLSQHHAFKKVERDGKGWLWSIVEGVSIEKEKKRRTTPPQTMPPGHMPHQTIYQAGHPPHMMPHPYGPGPMQMPNYQVNHQMPHNLQPGQHPHFMRPPPMNGMPYAPPGPQPPMNGQPPPPGFVASMPQLAPVTAPQQYSSPYAPKPPAAAPPSHPGENQQSPIQQPPIQQLPSNAVQTPPAIAPAASQKSPQQPTPPYQTQQSSILPTPLSRPQHSQKVLDAVETFKQMFMPGFKISSDNAEAIMASAVNRLLGYTEHSTVPGEPYEEQIMGALRNILESVPEWVNSRSGPAPSSNLQNGQMSPQSQTNQEGTHRSASQQPTKLTGPESSAPAVMRPSFTGMSGRPNGNSIPRPSMTIPGMKRANSGSPAPPRPSGPLSASPAAAPSIANGATGANAASSVPTSSEIGQIAGVKRPLEDAEDMRDNIKRISTSAVSPQLKT